MKTPSPARPKSPCIDLPYIDKVIHGVVVSFYVEDLGQPTGAWIADVTDGNYLSLINGNPNEDEVFIYTHLIQSQDFNDQTVKALEAQIKEHNLNAKLAQLGK